MIKQYLIKKAFLKLEKGPLNIMASQCVVLRHKSATCDKCIKVCSKNAIKISEEILIDEDKCNLCGDCYESCPTGVYSLSAITDKKDVSRREFFSFVKKKAADTSVEIVNGFLNNQNDKMPKILPEKRINLFKKKRQINLKDLDDKYLPFTDLKIDNKCDMCNLCVIFCPTGALSTKESKENKKINFKMSHCTKCDLCIIACPKEAISYSDKINIDTIKSKKEKMLFSHKLSSCTECGKKEILLKNNMCERCNDEKSEHLFLG